MAMDPIKLNEEIA